MCLCIIKIDAHTIQNAFITAELPKLYSVTPCKNKANVVVANINDNGLFLPKNDLKLWIT